MSLILTINSGSSSLKFKLFHSSIALKLGSNQSRQSNAQPGSEALRLLIKGSISNIRQSGQRPSIVIIFADSPEDGKGEKPEDIKGEDGLDENNSPEECLQRVFKHIDNIHTSQFAHSISETNKSILELITIVTHRVVHGGTADSPMQIPPGGDEAQLQNLEELSSFAPLHNHSALLIIKACIRHLPHSTQILAFDTLFHRTIPTHVYTYPLPPSKSDNASEPLPIPLRKYGFHGLSYRSILRSVGTHLEKPTNELNAVIAHLGSGGSCCLVWKGQSWDTSMGLSPLDGLVGGTRSGSVDPTLIFHHMPDCGEKVELAEGVPITKAEILLNKESGLKAIAGTSDFGTIVKSISNPSYSQTKENATKEEHYKLAYDIYLDRLLNYISTYLVKLTFLVSSTSQRDPINLIFTGGIGAKSSRLRSDVCHWLGSTFQCEIDEGKNDVGLDGEVNVAEITRSSNDGSSGKQRLRVFVCETDEELEAAIMVQECLGRA
jgi:acetate kinase